MTNQQLSTRFTEAFEYARSVHDGHTRKGSSIPYLSHLMAVAAKALENGADEDIAIACLLHDTVEDQPERATFADIAARFGSRVEAMVRSVSEPKDGLPWAERKDAYEQLLRDASDDALLVSMADKAHNLHCLVQDVHEEGERAWEKFNSDKASILNRYRKLHGIYIDRIPGRLAEDIGHNLALLE